MSSSWVWDPSYNQHRIWSQDEQCWVLRDGQRLGQPAVTTQQPVYGASVQQAPLTPQNIPNVLGQQQQYHGVSVGQKSPYISSNTVQRSPTNQFGNPFDTASLRSALSQDAARASSATAPNTSFQNTIIHGTEGNRERLDPRYRKRDNPRKFFKVGKFNHNPSSSFCGAPFQAVTVFKIYWAEPAGDDNDEVSIGTDHQFGERFAYKIKWLIVVKQQPNSCLCVPIQTYGKRGIGKPGLDPKTHAIAFAGEKCPNLRSAENPKKNQGKLRDPIRVEPRSHNAEMHQMSRINYEKVFTIEHNVKVYDFGKVHRQYEHRLVTCFNYVLNRAYSGGKNVPLDDKYDQYGEGAEGFNEETRDEEDDENAEDDEDDEIDDDGGGDDDDDDDDDDDNQRGAGYGNPEYAAGVYAPAYARTTRQP